MENGYSLCLNKWALDKEIQSELSLLLIISSLCAEKGYCYANNDFFAKIFDTNATLISRKIKKLEDKGYLSIEYEKKGCEVVSRKLRLSNSIIHDYLNQQSCINNNNKNNNKDNISNDILQKENIEFNNICEEIINHLNTRIGSHYKPNSKDTTKLIKRKLKEGFTVDDFKTVIDKMCVKWTGTKWQEYLRPETLFGNKFENYLNLEVKQSINNLHLTQEDIDSIFNL